MAGNKKKGVPAHPPNKKGTLPPIPADLARVTFKIVLAPRTPPADDVPIEGATVEITGVFKEKTDAKGEVVTHAFPPGTFQLLVSKPPNFGPVPNSETDPFVAGANFVEPNFQVSKGENFATRELSDGSGVLVVKTHRADLSVLPDCDVTIAGSGTQNVKNTGQVEFRRVPGGKKDVTAKKLGFGPNETPFKGFGPAKPEVEVVLPAGRKKETRILLGTDTGRVTRIKATLPVTVSLRSPVLTKAAFTPAPQTLTSSAADTEDLAANPPVVLIRGCKTVELEVETTPAGKAVDWGVKPNDNKEAAPTITPKSGGTKADLSTNKTGSFAVIAAIGDSRKVWNVVFVFVDVITRTSKITPGTGYVDNGSNATRTRFRSGKFIFGQQAMEGTVEVELTGGGSSKDIGLTPIRPDSNANGNITHVGKINLHILQNGTSDTLQGVYPGTPNGLAKDTPCTPISAAQPILDGHGPPGPPANSTVINAAPVGSNPVGAFNFSQLGSPFAYFDFGPDGRQFRVQQLSPRRFLIRTGDSPTAAFPRRHSSPTKARLATIDGGFDFKTAIATASLDALNEIVVHAEFSWQSLYGANVQYAPGSTVGTFVKTTAKTVVPAGYTLVSQATGGQDAGAARYEVFEPAFANGLSTPFS